MDRVTYESGWGIALYLMRGVHIHEISRLNFVFPI